MRKVRLVGNQNQIRPAEGLEFVEFCNVGDQKPVISFADAIADLYRLVKYIEVKRTGIATRNGELLLRCKCLIYEIKDYFLNVPEELGTYFVDFAYKLPSREQELERAAEELKGGPFKNKDERAKVIKLQLMAAIWGANQLYQEHNAHSYNRASHLLEKVNKIINETLPYQHEEVRESFGILGLAQYLTGRVLFRKGLIKESRAAFKKSGDAYLARLRQKEDFCRLGLILPAELEEKVAVTIRRAALVASGDGYHYFANGQLGRALESLTLARAALTHNSGRIHLIYVDMLYWSCRRAMESSNLPKVEECIRALKSCREGFRELIAESPHFHRAGIQLALALLYRRKLTGDVQNSDYDEGLGYLEDAIAYAERKTDKSDVLNPSLLAAAYVVKSRYQRSRYVRDPKAEREKYYTYLNEAKDTAAWAHLVSQGIRMMQTEASATLGEVHTDLAELNLAYHNDEFPINFNAALGVFQRAMVENDGQSPRNDAVCLLGLTRLCLLNPNTEVAAQEYFAQWKKIESLVEHDSCKTLAQELMGRFSPRVLLIKATETLDVDYWKKKLDSFLMQQCLKDFVAKYLGESCDDPTLKRRLTSHLRTTLGYAGATVSELINETDLLSKVKMMLEKPVEIEIRRKKD